MLLARFACSFSFRSFSHRQDQYIEGGKIYIRIARAAQRILKYIRQIVVVVVVSSGTYTRELSFTSHSRCQPRSLWFRRHAINFDCLTRAMYAMRESSFFERNEVLYISRSRNQTVRDNRLVRDKIARIIMYCTASRAHIRMYTLIFARGPYDHCTKGLNQKGKKKIRVRRRRTKVEN